MSRRPQEQMSDIAMVLYGIVKQQPGIHFRSLGRAARLSSVGQLRHHLDHLRRQGAIVEVKDGRFKRFFIAGEHDPQVRQGLARFARRVPRRIGMLLLARPMNRTELRRSLDCADSTLGYHLNRMVALGDLVRTRGRNCCMYSLSDPEFVRRLLRHQAPAAGPHDEGLPEMVPPQQVSPLQGRGALAPEYALSPDATTPETAQRAADAEPAPGHPGRGIRMQVREPSATPPPRATRDEGPPMQERPTETEDNDNDNDDEDDRRARSRPAGRVHVVPKRSPEIWVWDGQD